MKTRSKPVDLSNPCPLCKGKGWLKDELPTEEEIEKVFKKARHKDNEGFGDYYYIMADDKSIKDLTKTITNLLNR